MPTYSTGTSSTDLLGFLTILDSLKDATTTFDASLDPTQLYSQLLYTTGSVDPKSSYTIYGSDLSFSQTTEGGRLNSGTVTEIYGPTGDAVTGLSLTATEINGATSTASLLTALNWTIKGNDFDSTTDAAALTGNNTWNLLGGNDSFLGGSGNDVVDGGRGNDILNGGLGADIIEAGSDHDMVYGGAGADVLFGETGNDTIYGDNVTENATTDGNDTINGGSGTNVLYGGHGDDTFNVTSASVNTFFGGSGTDTVNVQIKTKVHLANASSIETVNVTVAGVVLAGTAAGETINAGSLGFNVTGVGFSTFDGGAGNDTLTGAVDVAGTTLRGGDGDDILNAGGAGNVLLGDSGNDALNGGAGNDNMYGGYGNDVITGGGGNDIFDGGLGSDLLTGGAGNDLFHINTSSGRDVINGGSGTDTAPDTDTVKMNVSGKIYVDDLTDIEVLEVASGKTVTLLGGSGVDTLSLLGTSFNTKIFSFSNVAVFDGGLGDDTLIGDNAANKLRGGGGADIITAWGDADRVWGGAGHDRIRGVDGDDFLWGDSGNDILNGGAGHDVLDGGLGNDILVGGAGNDIFNINTTWGNDRIDGDGSENTASADVDIVNMNVSGRIYHHNLTDIDQLVVKATRTVTLTGSTGNDQMDVLGNDTAVADLGYALTNLRIFDGHAGNDSIVGDGNANIILGGSGNDILKGGAGADRIQGGTGQDDMTGGGDSVRDTFIFKSFSELGKTASSADMITDFDSGVDKIDLNVFNFRWQAGSAFSSTISREVRYDATSKTLLLDTDADAAAEYQIRFNGTSEPVGFGDIIY